MPEAAEKPCARCKKEARRPGQSYCRQCVLEYNREWRARNPDHRERRRKFYANNRRRINLSRTGLGIGTERYAQLFEEQGGVCALCSMPETVVTKTGVTRSLSIDHDHSTGKLRGLLCQRCNAALGGFREDPEILAIAIDYLKRGAA